MSEPYFFDLINKDDTFIIACKDLIVKARVLSISENKLTAKTLSNDIRIVLDSKDINKMHIFGFIRFDFEL